MAHAQAYAAYHEQVTSANKGHEPVIVTEHVATAGGAVISHALKAFDGPGTVHKMPDGRVIEVHGTRFELYAVFATYSDWLAYRRPMPESFYWNN